MKRINLLPQEAQRLKDVRRNQVFMAAVQAAIFLAGIALFAMISFQEGEIQNRIRQNLSILADIQSAEMAKSQPYTNILEWHEPFLRQETLVNMIKMPLHVSIDSIRAHGGEIRLVCRTRYLPYIEKHESMLREIFIDTSLIRVNAAQDGYFVYELRFTWRY